MQTDELGFGIKARVMWRSRITGFVGHGEYIAATIAERAVDSANREYPELEHWVQYDDGTTIDAD